MDQTLATKADISNLREEFGAKLDGVRNELKSDIRRLEGKVSGLEGTVGGLQGKVEGLEGKVEGLENKVDRLEGKVDVLEGKVDRVAVDQARLRGEIFESQDRLQKTIETNSSRILRAIEDFAGKTQDVDRRTLVFDKMLGDHRSQLDDHEKRLRFLEGGS